MSATGRNRDPIRWGVLGATSTISRHSVLPAMVVSGGARLITLGTRSGSASQLHAFGAERIVDSYDDVLKDPDVEAIYIPLPNSMHAKWTIRAAKTGHHVLCEKPLATTRRQAQQIANACTRAGVVLMEAYPTPFHPRSEIITRLVASGRLGEPRFAHATFTEPLTRQNDYRRRADMGGGALLDLGIYCVEPILAAYRRQPTAITASARVTPAGVDASFSGWLDFGDGATATIACSHEAPEQQRLELVGTDARLTVDRAFTPNLGDTTTELRRRDGSSETITASGDNPYQRMIEHFADIVRGRAEPKWCPADSTRIAGVIDDLIRAARLQVRPDGYAQP